MTVDFGRICRLCMKQSEKLLSLFFHDNSILERVMCICPNLKLRVGDEMPDKVCTECVHQVNVSYNFKLQCETNDVTLRQMMLKAEDCPLSDKEEVCEIDKVKLEFEEAEITVEEHGVNVDSTEDHHRRAAWSIEAQGKVPQHPLWTPEQVWMLSRREKTFLPARN